MVKSNVPYNSKHFFRRDDSDFPESPIEVTISKVPPQPYPQDHDLVQLGDINVWRDSHTEPDRYRPFYEPLVSHLHSTGKQDVDMLDVGCSTGKATRDLKKYLERVGYNVNSIGLDIKSSIVMTAYTREHVDHALTGVSQDLPVRDSSIDIIVSHALVDYLGIDQQAQSLLEFKRVLKDNGIAICTLIAPDEASASGVIHDQYALTKVDLNNLAVKSNNFKNLAIRDLKPYLVPQKW